METEPKGEMSWRELQQQRAELMGKLAELVTKSKRENGDPEIINKAKETLAIVVDGLLSLNAQERGMLAKLAPEKE